MLLVILNYCRILCGANCHNGVSLSWHLINVLGHLFFTIWCLFQSLDHQIDGVGPVYLDTMVTGQKNDVLLGFTLLTEYFIIDR